MNYNYLLITKAGDIGSLVIEQETSNRNMFNVLEPGSSKIACLEK